MNKGSSINGVTQFLIIFETPFLTLTTRALDYHKILPYSTFCSSSNSGSATMCVKDCSLHNQKIDMIILIACLVGWLNSSPIEILKLKARSLKTTWAAWAGIHMQLCVHLQGPQSLANCVDIHIKNYVEPHPNK